MARAAEVTVAVTAYCSDCGAELASNGGKYPGEIQVDPCEACVVAAEERGAEAAKKERD